MKILIAEDDNVSRKLLESTLARWEHDVVTTVNGEEALEILQSPNPPQLAILDWMMPKLDGVEVVRKLRAGEGTPPTYLILLTARDLIDDVVTGLDAGANDYLTKPFNRNELQARVNVGIRVMELENSLADRIEELEDALATIKSLKGLIPICAYCKKIRNDGDYWQQLEIYISEHSEAEFSHGICPDCFDDHLKDELDKNSDKKTR
jgi:DNA-binding response OmpR family regulator